MLVPPPIFGILLVSILPCCVAEVQSNVQQSVYCVTPSRDPDVTCQTLDEYITDGTLNDSHSKFVFLNGTHHLTKSLMVYDSESLTLQGSEEGNNSVQVVCESRWTIALSFTRVSFLTIQNISFVNCSYNNSFSGHEEAHHVVSALHFEGGSNLTLSDVRILNGGFSIINTYEQVEITRMNVVSYLYQKVGRKNLTHSFGGSYFNYFTCSSKLNLTISESTFEFHNEIFFDSYKSKDKESSHGLGLVFNCTNAHINFMKLLFDGFQSVGDGGNFMIIFQKNWYARSTNDYIVKVSECKVVNGHAIQGGGAFISIVQPYAPYNTDALVNKNPANLSIIKISSTDFINNSALGGGALSFKLKEFSRHPIVSHIRVEKCKFIANYLKTEQSHGGIAIQMSSFHVRPSTYHCTPSFTTTFRNCLIRDNYIRTDRTCSPGNGVITMVKTLHFYIINSEIVYNNCTAIKAIASNLLLEGQVNITNNHGSSGGGLLLCDDSTIILKPNTQVRIEQNNATHTGGGITVESQCLQTRPMCFFQLSEEITYNISLLDTVKVVLTDNTAGYAGFNLFGGSVDYCYLVHPPHYHKYKALNAMAVFNKTFIDLPLANSSVTSIARRICFCYKGQKNCSTNWKVVHAYPGETFKVNTVPVGQLNGNVPASVRARSPRISKSELIQNIGKSTCTNLYFTVKSNKTHEHISLHIQHEGDVGGYIKSSLFKKARINVTLKHCPVGFKLDKRCQEIFHHCKCTCDDVLNSNDNYKLTCSIKDQTIKKPSWLWIGYISDPYKNSQSSKKFLVSHICPFDYCSVKSNKVNVLGKELMQDSQCHFNRTGILCGACSQNLSMILGSSACWSCSNKSLVLILVFALAGVMLIMILTICNVTIAEGRISGVMFYANIVHISDTLFISSESPFVSTVLKTLIAWINLDLGISACFYDGMDAYAKAWLQFAFPLYLWILSGLIVFLCNRYISVTRLFGTNSVRVLATVILLSFTKLLQGVITTLSCVNLPLYKNGTVETTRYLWTNDPNILCLQGKYIPLFALGIVFSIVWAIFIVFLLFIQCWPRLRCCSRIQRLKPFTDSFTGPNTSHGRFWTGLLLLSRSVIAVAYGFYANGILQNHYYASIAVTCVCLLLISAGLPSGVYNKKSNNLLETFFLFHLLFLTFAAGKELYNYAYASVSFALIVFSCILIYQCWKRFEHTQCVTILRLKIINRIKRCFKKREVVEESDDIFIDGSAHPKYCTFNQDREPLLASLGSYH